MNIKDYDVKIIYVQHPDGSIPVPELIQDIIKKAKKDSLFARLAKHIRFALTTLKVQGVPDWNIQRFSYEWMIETSNGWMVRVDPLVKRLDHAYPLYELRINEWRYPSQAVGKGYGFRIIFFTHYQGDIQYIFFVNGMIKREKSPPEFDYLIAEAQQIYQDFIRDKQKYLSKYLRRE